MIKPTTRIASWISVAIVSASLALSANGGDVTDIVEIDTLPIDSGYNKIWQPFIAKWTDKHYVASYGLQLRGKGDMGDLVCSISKDRGKTWSAPIMIFDHRLPNGSVHYAYNNSVLFRPPGQDVLWCFAMRTPMHITGTAKTPGCVQPTPAMEGTRGRQLNSQWTTTGLSSLVRESFR